MRSRIKSVMLHFPHLVKRDRSDVPNNHASDSSSSVVPSIVGSGVGAIRNGEEGTKSTEDVHEVRTEVDIGVLHEDTDGESSIASYFGFDIAKSTEEMGEEGLLRGDVSTLMPHGMTDQHLLR